MSGSSFDKSVLNPANKISKYVSTFSKAANLGAYSTDLSFCFLYKQNQDFNNYLKNINELVTALGIDGSYGTEVNKRLQANNNNLDFTKHIDDVNFLRASMILGAGIEYNLSGNASFYAGIRFNNGFTDILDDKKSKMNNNVVGLELGFFF